MPEETYRHGVYVSEVPTSLVPMISVASPTVAIGTAPIDTVEDATKAAVPNTPVLCHTLKEFTEQFGWSDDFEKYTLCEVAYVHFQLFNVAPVVFINVYDPATHKTTGENPTGDVTKVAANDIIGGYDTTTGKNKGLECVEEIYPRFGLIPGTIIVPKYSCQSAVAAVIKAKCTDINGVFQAVAVADIDTTTVKTYTAVNAAKNTDNFMAPKLIDAWPKVALGGQQMYLSTQAAALMGVVDSRYDNIPYKSPSNENLQCDQTILADGTDIFLGKAQANYLNGIGVITALNFVGGWKLWGNRTSAYPSNPDPKDSFIACRRMMNWVANTLVVSFWSKIDDPLNKRLIESTLDRAQIWLNGLVARGALVGGRVAFLEAENPVTDLADGKIRFHVYICPPTPAREIEFIQEMDVSYFKTLFE